MTPTEFKKLRLQACYESQTELAGEIGLSKQAIHLYENGKRPIPGPIAYIMERLTSRL